MKIFIAINQLTLKLKLYSIKKEKQKLRKWANTQAERIFFL